MIATEAEIVNVPGPPELDAGVLELDETDVAENEAYVVMAGRLLDVAAYDKTGKESGVV